MALKATVCIETELRKSRTVLKKSFCDAPFKLMDITEDKRRQSLQLMLMSSSPGMLDEDEFTFQINLGDETSLTLQTQSYQRIFQMKKGAVQKMNVRLGQGASFRFLPHPSVPHKEAIFKGKNKIFLSNECSLLWGEVVSCGRKANDEVFRYISYHSLTEIFLNERLAVKENLFLKPGEMNVHSIGQMEGYTHGATLLYLDERANVNELINRLADELQTREGFVFGISALPVNGLIVRLLGNKAEGLFALLNGLAASIESAAAQQMFSKASAHV